MERRTARMGDAQSEKGVRGSLKTVLKNARRIRLER